VPSPLRVSNSSIKTPSRKTNEIKSDKDENFPHNHSFQQAELPVLQGVSVNTSSPLKQSRTIKMNIPIVNQTGTFNNIGESVYDTSHIETPANPMFLEREDDTSLSSDDLSQKDKHSHAYGNEETNL